MTKERWIIVGIVAAAGAASAVYLASRPAERIDVDLIQRLDAAERRPADPPPREWCMAKEASLGGEWKLAIAVLPSSRLTWKVTVPPRASLRAWIGLEPDAWNGEGDGVLFRIGVSDGSGFRDLLVRQVNPYRVPDDRRWVPVTVDLSAYAGLDVSLILNTNASPPDQGNDTRHDRPVWGAPAMVTARQESAR